MRSQTCRRFAAIFCVLALSAGAVLASPSAPSKASVAAQSKALLERTVDAAAPGAAVLVARGDQVLFRAARGRANLELDVPLSPEQIFLIGSNTKLFTAVTILKFAEAGKLSIDDPLSRFLPDYPNAAHITIHQLLNHTSGIKDFAELPNTSEQHDFTTQQLIGLFRDQPVDFAPGADWKYDNSGYVLLGAILEKISGEPWHETLRKTLLEPLRLPHTGYSEVGKIFPGRVAGYSLDEHGAVINVEATNTSGAQAAGGLASSVDDLFHWLRALHTGKVLSPASYLKLITPVPAASGRSTSFGYGLETLSVRGVAGLWHSGNIQGFASAQAYFPTAAVSVVVLSNTDAATPALLMKRLAAIAFGDPYPQRKSVRLSAAQLQAVAGVYRVDANVLRRITVQRGALQVQRSDAPPRDWLAASADEFYAAQGISSFRAVRDAAGSVDAIDFFDQGEGVPVHEPKTDAPFPAAAQ